MHVMWSSVDEEVVVVQTDEDYCSMKKVEGGTVLDAEFSDELDYHQSTSGKMEEEDRQKKKQYPNTFQQIPVVLLTAKAMVSDRIEGYRAGASGYLPKPFRPEELLSMIDNLMKKQERECHDQLYFLCMVIILCLLV